MALTTAQQVRLKIQDQPLAADDVYVFDGSGIIFALPHRVITSATGFILDSNSRWSATGGVTFSEYAVSWGHTGSANSAYRTRYMHSVFSDDEIGHFTAVGGTVNGAALEAVQALMFDGLKRAKWVAPDSSEYDDTAAMKLLNDLYKTLKDEQHQEAIGAGGFQEWAITQGE